jgi:hypothetical protein
MVRPSALLLPSMPSFVPRRFAAFSPAVVRVAIRQTLLCQIDTGADDLHHPHTPRHTVECTPPGENIMLRIEYNSTRNRITQ